jgi:hypothetical protein
MRSIVYVMTVNDVANHQRVEGTCKLIRLEYLYVLDVHKWRTQSYVGGLSEYIENFCNLLCKGGNT